MADNINERQSGLENVKKSKIGLVSVVCMIYAVACGGAFGMEEMLPSCGPGMTVLIIIIVAIIFAMPVAFICSEMGAARPVEGGRLIWVKEALGEYWFFCMTWVNFILAFTANAAYVVLAVNYAGKLFEMTQIQAFAIKLVVIVIFLIINLLGAKNVGVVNTICSVIVIIAFAVIAIVGFANYSSNPFVPFIPKDFSIFETVGAGLAIAIWGFASMTDITVLAGEIEDSAKIIPKALVIVVPIMVLTYILPISGGVVSIGNWESWSTEPGGLGYSTVLTQFLGDSWGIIFLVVAVIGQCSIYNMCIATGSRIVMTLSDGNMGPKFLTYLSRKRGVPYVSVLAVTIVTAVLVNFEFVFLVILEVFFFLIATVLMVIATMILRRRIGEENLPIRVPFGQVGHNIFSFLVISIAVITGFLNGTDFFLGGFVWMITIPIFYIVLKRRYGGLTIMEPEMYPLNPKTKLGFGDIGRMGYTFIGMGIYGIIGKFFLGWYEGSWGKEYYLEEYSTGIFSDYYRMLTIIMVLSILVIVVGLIFLFMSKKLDK